MAVGSFSRVIRPGDLSILQIVRFCAKALGQGNVFPIRSPALRDRLDDLPLLVDILLNRIVNSGKLVRAITFDSVAVSVLQSYAWPGNVRELENVIERLAINAPRTCVVSAADVSLDLEVNGFAQTNEHREIILAKRLRCLTDSRVSVRHLSKHQELDLYIQELRRVGGGCHKGSTTIRHQAHNSSHAHKTITKKLITATHRLNKTHHSIRRRFRSCNTREPERSSVVAANASAMSDLK